MKNILIFTLFGLSVIVCISCHNNRLKNNEKELMKEILIQEKEKKDAERIVREKQSAETGNSLSGSLRKKEIRSVDSRRPPINLDILGTRDNSRQLKLSDVATSIRYVKLQTPPDTSLLYDHFFYRSDMMSNIISDGEHIIFQGLFGLTRFNMHGEYQETIWKNETGIKLFGTSLMSGGKDFFGVLPSNPVSLSNGNLYFAVNDGPSGLGQVMKYQPGNNFKISVQSQTEIPGRVIIPGDTLLRTSKRSMDRFDWIFGTGPDNWAGINRKWNAGRSGALLVTYNEKGDTLCQFTDFDRISNFSYTQVRHPVEFTRYSFNGLLTIKQEYNDTVFRLIPPDRLLPVYIIDFGEYKVSYMDGLNPDFNLSDKYLLYSLLETYNFLFIRYTQNSDGLANRKKKAVKFYNVLFDKKEGKLYHQQDFTQVPEGIINDLDGGMPFWPEVITPQGEMMKLVSGKMMKDYINSTEFKEAGISEEDRQKQSSMASGLKDTDMIILIVK